MEKKSSCPTRDAASCPQSKDAKYEAGMPKRHGSPTATKVQYSVRGRGIYIIVHNPAAKGGRARVGDSLTHKWMITIVARLVSQDRATAAD